jgi:hypothetical protein
MDFFVYFLRSIIINAINIAIASAIVQTSATINTVLLPCVPSLFCVTAVGFSVRAVSEVAGIVSEISVSEGEAVGSVVGAFVETSVGFSVGAFVGSGVFVGAGVGSGVLVGLGVLVGAGVAVCIAPPPLFTDTVSLYGIDDTDEKNSIFFKDSDSAPLTFSWRKFTPSSQMGEFEKSIT